MTPEEAQELLRAIDNSDPSILSELMDWKEVAEALETIAGMHYEYAVQITDVTGETRFAKSLRGATFDIESARWTPNPFESLANYWRESNNVEDCLLYTSPSPRDS